MPYRRLPNSTPAVLRALRVARDKYKNTPVAAERAISAEQFAQLNDAVPTSLLNRFQKEVSEVDNAQALQAPLTTALAQAAARLTMFVSHFHQVLDLGIARGTFQSGARSYYGRDVSNAVLPDLSTYLAVEEAAQKIVDGEAARSGAEGAGYVKMAVPTADEVETILQDFRTVKATTQQAQARTDDEREDVDALYAEAHALAVDLAETVEFFYRKDPDASSRRAKHRRWGVVYIYEPGETPDPEDPEVPTPPPPTP